MSIKINYKTNEQMCRTCKVEKDLSKFDRHKRYRSGYTSECKKCKSLKQKNIVKKVKNLFFNTNKELMTRAEVCSYLGIGYSTIYLLHESIKHKKIQGKLYYEKKDVDNFAKRKE